MRLSSSLASAGVLIILLTVSSFAASDAQLKQMKDAADKVLADTDNVRASKNAGAIFDYASALEVLGHTNAALVYLERGLVYSPWRLEEQLNCARLLRGAGRHQSADEKARLVLQRAETDALLARSSEMLGQPFVGSLKTEPWPDARPSLALVPIGDVDVWLVRTLQSNLISSFRIPVVIRQPTVRLPAANRDPVKVLADRCREPLKKSQFKSKAGDAARRLSLAPSYMEDDAAVLKVFRQLLREESENKKDPEALRQFDEEVQVTRKLGKQWKADEVLAETSRALSGELPAGNAYLAITRLDMFAGESRYVFGVGDSRAQGAVMSYLRFTAALLGQPPDRERLSKRAYKQALSSVGFAFGVPRCSHPVCARAYPNSLEEHDAKGIELCELCEQSFKKALNPKQ